MSDLSSLIARLEKAEGPSHELDRLIASVVLGRSIGVSKWTASLDAAVSLAERVLPNWHADIDLLSPPPMSDKFGARLFDANGSWQNVAAEAITPALALVLATLRALQSQTGEA